MNANREKGDNLQKWTVQRVQSLKAGNKGWRFFSDQISGRTKKHTLTLRRLFYYLIWNQGEQRVQKATFTLDAWDRGDNLILEDLAPRTSAKFDMYAKLSQTESRLPVRHYTCWRRVRSALHDDLVLRPRYGSNVLNRQVSCVRPDELLVLLTKIELYANLTATSAQLRGLQVIATCASALRAAFVRFIVRFSTLALVACDAFSAHFHLSRNILVYVLAFDV